MSDDRRLDQNEPDTHNVSKVVGEDQGVDQSRRKFNKTTFIAAPVIMTLASRPVLGSGRRDCLSQMMSAHHSGPNTCDASCKPQHSCKDWKSRPEKWSQAGCNAGKIEWIEESTITTPRKVTWNGAGTKCRDVFSFYTGDETMMGVLWKADYDKTGCGFIAAAVTAHCNASSDSASYGLTPAEVQDKCNKALSNKYENIYTKQGDNCIDALRKEFEYLNSEECGQENLSFNCDDRTNWGDGAYDDCKEYYAFRKSTKWRNGTDRECKNWSEYKSNCKGQGSYGEWKASADYNIYDSNNSYKNEKGWTDVSRPWRRND